MIIIHVILVKIISDNELDMYIYETVQIKASYVALNFLCFYLILI
jgi:hypothetical protein